MLYLIARYSRGTRPVIYSSETLLNSWREHPLKHQEHADWSKDAWEDVEDFDDVALYCVNVVSRYQQMDNQVVKEHFLPSYLLVSCNLEQARTDTSILAAPTGWSGMRQRNSFIGENSFEGVWNHMISF
jgi:hypothetical protein